MAVQAVQSVLLRVRQHLQYGYEVSDLSTLRRASPLSMCGTNVRFQTKTHV